MNGWLMLFLLASSTARSQPTINCAPATGAAVDAAVAANPAAAAAWTEMVAYATRRHFNTTAYVTVTMCTDGTNTAWVVGFENWRVGSPRAALRYMPTLEGSEQVGLTFQKNRRTYVELTPSGGSRVTLDASGQAIKMRLLDGRGNVLHIQPIVPLAASKRRHL